MANDTYIGLTIGPIIKTMTNAKRTGQFWGSSYIFSYLMEKIIIKVKESNISKEIIIPYADFKIKERKNNNRRDKLLNTEVKGVGLFPDRLIFKAEDRAFEEMETVVSDTICELAGHIKCELEGHRANKQIKLEEIKNYLEEYIKIYYLEKKVEDNPVLELTPHLDMLELKNNIIPVEKENYLMEFLDNKVIKKSYLAEREFPEKMVINSIPTIATKDLIQNDKKAEDILKKCEKRYPEDKFENFYKKIEDEGRKLRKYHKYVAYVQADGDNIGQIINQLKVKNKNDKKLSFNYFSKKLFNYAKKAVKKIIVNKGFPVYAGGDDLMFIAPLKYKEKNIFELINELSDIFNIEFCEYRESPGKMPALSFGLSIFYYKYPLYEARENVINLLFNKAKNFSYAGKKKNAVSFNVYQHSGSYFGTDLRKKDPSQIKKNKNPYDCFLDLIKEKMFDEYILSSIPYRLNQDKEILSNILKKEDKKERLVNYFDNTFNKTIHDTNRNFINKTRAFMMVLAQELNNETKEKKQKEIIDSIIKTTYSCLRVLNFMSEESDLQ